MVGTKRLKLLPIATETLQIVLIASTRTSGILELRIVQIRGCRMVLACGARRMRGSRLDMVARMLRLVSFGVMDEFTAGSRRTRAGSRVWNCVSRDWPSASNA